jgi:hypothetical protein
MTNDVYVSMVIQNLSKALPHSKELHNLSKLLQQLQDQFSENDVGQTISPELVFGACTASQEYIAVSNFFVIFILCYLFWNTCIIAV